MNKLNLEDFIRKNRNEFDQQEPSEMVWLNLSKNLKKKKVIHYNPVLFRIAAVVTGIAIISVIVFRNDLFTKRNLIVSGDPEINELLEAEAFYSRQVSGKLAAIRKCYVLHPELKNEVETDLNELETMYKSLRQDLKENLSSRAVIEAMIENSRYRLKVVDDVLEQIEC